MPGFSTWGAGSYNRMTPLTPPEYDSAYSNRMADQSFYSRQSSQYRNSQMGDGFKQYGQLPTYTGHRAYNGPSPTRLGMPPAHEYNPLAAYAPRMTASRSYVPEISAPILPPIRPQETMDPYAHYANANLSAPREQKPKEEKATGGVAAHLDYDIATMSDFVAEMSQGMYAIYQSGICLSDIDLMRSVNPNTHVDAQYRKYVTQILTSTRLPSSTIMLGLFYLASRMKILSAKGVNTWSRDAVYRMLTTCLLLGSKFLDDNTFQNRSWAEVSNINVRELNKMEIEWLCDFEWSIHGRMYDIHEGFFMWREHWLAYEEDTQIRKMKESQKLAPIDTNLSQRRPTHKPMMSPEGPIPAQYQRKPQFDTQWVSPLISEPSPPSAAYSGPATPEYYNSATWTYGHPTGYPSQVWSSNASTPVYVSSRSQSYQPTSSFAQQYTPSTWNGHGHGCGCTVYSKCKEHYFLPSNHYNLQSVAC